MNVAQHTAPASTSIRLPESVYAQRRRNVALGLVALVAVVWFAVSAPAPVETEVVTVTVAQGDTLWTLAEQFAPDNQDPRDWIYDVRTLNNLETSALFPGMQLNVVTPVND